MNEPDILYPAIFCFSMMVIGLVLTMWEFSRIRKSVPEKAEKGNAASRKPEGANTNTHRLSGV